MERSLFFTQMARMEAEVTSVDKRGENVLGNALCILVNWLQQVVVLYPASTV